MSGNISRNRKYYKINDNSLLQFQKGGTLQYKHLLEKKTKYAVWKLVPIVKPTLQVG